MISTSPDEENLLGTAILGARYTRMSAGEATEVVSSGFKVEGQLTTLATEKDDTFRVDAPDGHRYILKVAHPLEPESEVSLQIEVLRHIAIIDPGIPVPRLVPGCNGKPNLLVKDRAGQVRYARLLSYLDGVPLDRTDSNPLERFRIGEMLGRLRHATSSFTHPAASRVLPWDTQHLLTLEPLLQSVEDRDHRKTLEKGLGRFERFKERISRLRTQVLHNDFSQSNLIVDHCCPAFVTGIIDFGDVVRTAIAIDVATALLNQLMKNPSGMSICEMFGGSRDVLRGYVRVADVSEEERLLIPHLVMGRAITRALITLWRAKLFPENSPYILRNTEQCWPQLECFLAHSVDQVSSVLL
jgi:hydroxylysine kinase